MSLKKKSLSPGKRYQFIWLDTYSFGGWFNEEDLDGKTLEAGLQSSLGFFVKEAEDWYIIASHHNPHKDFQEWGTPCWIPKRAVIRYKEVR